MLHGNVHLHPFVLTICPFYGHLLFTNFKLYFGLMQIHACYAYLKNKNFLTEFFLIMMLKRLVSPSSFLQVQLPISILTCYCCISIHCLYLCMADCSNSSFFNTFYLRFYFNTSLFFQDCLQFVLILFQTPYNLVNELMPAVPTDT